MLISSKMGSIGDGRTGGNLYGYRMSKAAANCAGATLARDLKEEEVIVGLIHPGAVSPRFVPIVHQLLHAWSSFAHPYVKSALHTGVALQLHACNS